MDIGYHKKFIKNFKVRYGNNQKVKKQYYERLGLFVKDPRHPLLQDHPLKGKKLLLRAFSITGDIRVIYMTIGKKITFLDIGTHNQVY